MMILKIAVIRQWLLLPRCRRSDTNAAAGRAPQDESKMRSAVVAARDMSKITKHMKAHSSQQHGLRLAAQDCWKLSTSRPPP
jgi:hypothetical protein